MAENIELTFKTVQDFLLHRVLSVYRDVADLAEDLEAKCDYLVALSEAKYEDPQTICAAVVQGFDVLASARELHGRVANLTADLSLLADEARSQVGELLANDIDTGKLTEYISQYQIGIDSLLGTLSVTDTILMQSDQWLCFWACRILFLEVASRLG